MVFLADRGYRVIAHDRRGHGHSTQTWYRNNMDTFVDDLEELFEHLNVQGAMMAGYSHGGGEVTHFLGKHGTSHNSHISGLVIKEKAHYFSFLMIGSLARDASGWNITNRPLTMNMNELVQLGNFSPKMLPHTPFTTASSYYQSLAETEFMHLATQRNDAVDSEQDFRSKYVARRLFCELGAKSRLHYHTTPNSGPFKLFCDDLRPTNILLDNDMRIIAVIDWEFTYTAPAEFTFIPPWWLLLEMPEEWPRGVSDWTKTYQPRLETFLRVLKRQEDVAMANGNLVEAQRISGRMEESWEHGYFWVNYGARKSWAFDVVWPMMDAKFFGGDTTPDQHDLLYNEERMKLFGVEDREAMGLFIQKKLEDSKQRKLDDWDEMLTQPREVTQ